MTGLQLWAVVSDTEQLQLTRDIDAIARRWTTAPSPWKEHWDHLVTAAQRWEADPQAMQQALHRIADDFVHTGTTDLASPLQVRNLLVAGELVESRRTDMGFAFAPTPDHIDYTYGYVTSYRSSADGTIWESLRSWSAARQWLIAQAGDTDPNTIVDITITGPDPGSGAASRPLMTGTGLTAAELAEQLHRIDDLLCTTPTPVESSAHSWLDELRYDALCDSYRDTLLEQRNPWTIGHRFELRLRADDLRAAIVDYGDRTGLQSPATRANTDAIEKHLENIRRSVRDRPIEWSTAPQISTWFDDAVADAQHQLDRLTAEGLRLTYIDPAQRNRITTIGFDDDHWYIQHAHTASDDRTLTYDTPPHAYPTCADLPTTPDRHVAGTGGAVPENIIDQLRAFDIELHTLEQNLSCVQQLRDAIRAGVPYTLTRQHGHSAPTSRPPQRGGFTRHATPSDTSAVEQPAPAKPSVPQRKRRQPPKPSAHHHRRRL